jgi:DNA-directed RNA polymerase subunit beta
MSSGGIDKQVVRKSFGHLKSVVPVPDLIAVQSKSFNDFVQLDCLPNERSMMGIEKVLKNMFPIEHDGKMSLEYAGYELGNWACTCGKLVGIVNRYEWRCTSCKKSGCSRLDADLVCPLCQKKTARYKVCSVCSSRVSIQMPMTLEECRFGEQTFAMPLKIKMQLITWDIAENGARSVRDIKEQDVFFADLPVMADLYEEDGVIKVGSQGTFLINGVDRVVVSQMHRSPGVVFSQSKKAKDTRGKLYCVARIIPARGSWIDFEFDSNDCLYVRVDKKRKILATTFLQALGIARDAIIPLFYPSSNIYVEKGVFFKSVDDSLVGQRLERDMVPEELAGTFVGRRVTKELLARLKKDGIERLELSQTYLMHKVFAKDLVDQDTGEILIEQGASFTEDHYDLLKSGKKRHFEIIESSGYVLRPTIAVTLTHDHCYTQDDAFDELHAKLWPGDGSSIKDVKEKFEEQFFSSRLYDLTKVGRIRLNRKLGLELAEDITVLTKEDIVATVAYLVNLRERGEGEFDDIDHLGNRRVRLVGELLSNQAFVGFSRIERIVKERFRVQDIHSAIMPQDLLNVKPLSAVLREFFGTGQLSQFVDQTNPLAELAHKRRLSALGPGGVMKDRATFEVRDVHPSHYGRICPIETPEGQTIGLISSLSTYAMVNDLGFIESAYRPVKEGNVIDEVVFLDAFKEASQFIAQNDAIDYKRDTLKKGDVLARLEGNFLYVDSQRVSYVDLSPKQLVSVASALIPFLEHDDATRALMGANMQRQAVPLIKCEAPLVGTGMEREVCKALGTVIFAKRAGVVEYVASDKIIVRADETEFDSVEDWLSRGVDVYTLRKFQRSSHSTWMHQTPIVSLGDRVKVGDVLTDGTASQNGELALGTNLLVAFMPWHGYNFEDAIVLSQRLVATDALSSVSIDEYVVDARDTKLGPEEITRDIPNVSENALAGLDEDGIVRIGTRVAPGDILVGKVTLKGDVQYSPEEKLLRAIFGEKSREVRDTSLRVPPGVEGTVIDVKIFSRSGIRKDRRYKDFVAIETRKIETAFAEHVDLLKRMMTDKIVALLNNQKLSSKKVALNESGLREISFEDLIALKAVDSSINEMIAHMHATLESQVIVLSSIKEKQIAKLKKGDQLPSGVIKMIKVYVASKRHISAGDKIAGRHGNKGIVSTIVHREDMPYLENGTPVDIVLNPIGVPSRMNVGQILETILGFAGRELGTKLGEMLETNGYEEIKQYLSKYFGKELVVSYEKQHGKEGIKELAQRTARHGFHFETPVFEGASYEADIQPMLSDLGLPTTGAYRLRDGRSGDYFDQSVTVGMIYMLKLNHMVDDKLHARSVGPYSLVTQQPLGGKAQFGGQRFGEMEVWALEAYGAAYTLQELLTYKSDDVIGRNKVYSAIVKGGSHEISELGLPESFNVLIKELQSLALQVDLFKSSREDVSE